jgi:hypothetical protein
MFQRLTARTSLNGLNRLNGWAGWNANCGGDVLRANCGTGFSREGIGGHTADFRVRKPASSRLKPVPLNALRVCSGGG